jgi:hypothetical protein
MVVLGLPVLTSAQIQDRATARQDYINNYSGSSFTSGDMAWTGNIASCNAGMISSTVLNRVTQRINYFRRMVGVEAMVALESTRNAKCQQAALMMGANADLDHDPPMSWTCWTANGHEAAGASNLALGDLTIDIFMEDNGSNNMDVGHRRYVLHSKAKTFGCGLVTGPVAQSLWVSGNEGNPSVYNQFIAYPPNGYIPKNLVYPRWSFSLPNVSSATAFASATVTMAGPSGNVPLNIISRNANFADPTMVWEPTGIDNTNSQDIQYTVTVSGVVGAPQSSYTYTTTIFCPSVGSPPCTGDIIFFFNGTVSGIARAANSITTSSNLSVDGSAIFSAPIISLLQGFEVPAGHCFEANNVGCSFYGPLACQ